ncbi:complement C2 L homeolog precursor [Xenopus laevis]|uniref:Complement C2 n=3 Tax=Xenopus laevis TaxID=8355 RepID=A0A8J0Q8Q8_XENLA|nr:complement C2 L homeolog precursor [Xenopus laevis]
MDKGSIEGRRHLILSTFLLPFISSLVFLAGAECPPETGYKGDVSLTNGYNEASIVHFLCPIGQYPWPANSRICEATGKWSVMRSSTGRIYNSISCKKMLCPQPVAFENGEFYPRGPYFVGANITFKCNDGYTLRGSVERTCKRNARWSGVTAVCDDGAGHCPNPGIPPGAMKTGVRYDMDDSIKYECSRGLSLVGSPSRTCLESRRWSGREIDCQYAYSFDLPEDVQEQFKASLSGILNIMERPASFGRTIKITKDGILNVYFLLDASQSVGQANFDIYKACSEYLVDELALFDMTIQFGIISYATVPKVIIPIYDEESDNNDHVLTLIRNGLKYSDHKDKTGTNTKAALEEIYSMMSSQKETYKNESVWNSIHHIIILLTDGKANLGGRPAHTIKRIEDFLDIKHKREDYLDVYTFGIGPEVDMADLSEMASKKDGETHVFRMESANEMKTVFQKIVDIKHYGEMCGLNDESQESESSFRFPWNVLVKSRRSVSGPCLGSLISKSWVLSAAHCFKEGEPSDAYDFEIGGQNYKAQRIEIHNCYNISRKKSKNVNEDYDYDVALVQLKQNVKFSKEARPICIPCTEPANRAMKKLKGSTCKDHREQLMGVNEIPAGYLSKNKQNELIEHRVFIKTNKDRETCVAAVQKWPKFEQIDPVLMVSPRHLCVEGKMSCKGESGGSLFVHLRGRRRFFQVGVLNFGIFNPCSRPGQREPPPPGSEPRDFHFDVIQILPWMRKHVGNELEFLPDIQKQDIPACPT